MENEIRLVSRKERRRLAEQQRRKVQVRRGAALLGTTLTACSLVTPVAPANIQAEAATETRAATNTSAFIAEIASHAQPVAAANDLYASVMIAQAVVESAWGTSTLSKAPYYNLFGIKGSYQGNSVSMNTQEYLNGKWVTMNEPFRDYPSYQQSFEDNAYVLRNVYMGGQYYYRGAWKSNCSSYRDATAWLTGRYATAPHYAAALNNVIATYNLTRYDTPASGNAGGGATAGGSSSNSNSTNSGSSNASGTTSQTYTVKSGDSVWLIANKYGISMNQLIQWNNIKNNFIYPGQKLIVSKSATGSANTGNTGSNSSANNSGSSSANNNTSSNTNASSTSSSYYTVKSGDSVWLIANKYGISMNQLIQWNGIKNNLIHPGQKLVVGKTGSSSSTNNSSSSTGSSSSSNTGTSNNTSTNNNASSNTNTSGKYYTVKSGDSVWLVAHNNGITMNQLIQWNNIKNNFIYPGQKLLVSKTGNTTNTNQSNGATSNTNNASSTKTYKAVSGDSLWGIAQKYNMSVSQLKQLNNLTSDMIYIGQTLKVK